MGGTMDIIGSSTNMLQRERGRQANPPPRGPRSTHINSRRRPRSTSSESGRHTSNRDRKSRRQSDRRQTADRSKADMMSQHKMLHELQRRFDSSIVKMEGNSGFVEVRNEGGRNAWIYLVVTQCILLASVATSEQNGAIYSTALSLCVVQLTLSLFGTAYLLRTEHGYSTSSVRSQNMMSLRITLLSLMLQGAINFILLGRTNYFAVAGLAVANHNMLLGCWISFSLISYLFARSVASVLHGSSSEQGFKSGFCRLMSMLWTMHLLFQICVLSSSISIQISSICGGMLGSATSCQGVTAALILSVFNIPVCGICLLNIFSLVEMSDVMLVRVYGVSASVSLLIQAITTGLVTSVGGLASNPGNLYISTWINTVISLTILLRCMDSYWSVNLLTYEHLHLGNHDAMEESIAFQQSRPQAPLVRMPSMRSNKTSSTDSSQENEVKYLEPNPFLTLPAPPAYSEAPTRELVITRGP